MVRIFLHRKALSNCQKKIGDIESNMLPCYIMEIRKIRQEAKEELLQALDEEACLTASCEEFFSLLYARDSEKLVDYRDKRETLSRKVDCMERKYFRFMAFKIGEEMEKERERYESWNNVKIPFFMLARKEPEGDYFSLIKELYFSYLNQERGLRKKLKEAR